MVPFGIKGQVCIAPCGMFSLYHDPPPAQKYSFFLAPQSLTIPFKSLIAEGCLKKNRQPVFES